MTPKPPPESIFDITDEAFELVNNRIDVVREDIRYFETLGKGLILDIRIEAKENEIAFLKDLRDLLRFTYFYNAIYQALKDMEPHIIGNIPHGIDEQYVRRFKLALSLSYELRKNVYWPTKKHDKAVRILHRILALESSGWWV